MTKPLYFYNGTTFELVGPTTPQSPIAYQTSAPTAPATGDLWIDSDGDVDTYNRQLTRYYFVATASQTTITGIDANGLTLAYVAGSEAVYVNGALQVRGQDYTATNGTSVVLSSGLAVNDVVEIFAYTAFTVANAYTKSETDGVAAAAAGLRAIVPPSVAVGSGSASVNTAGQVSFTTVSSVSLNGCFSSTYDNYKIVVNVSAVSNNDGDHFLRVRSGTSDVSSNYIYSSWVKTSGGTDISYNAGTASYVKLGAQDGASTPAQSYSVDIFSPFLSQGTRFLANVSMQRDDGSWAGGVVTGLSFNQTSYDGLTLHTQNGTFSGTISIYGYKD
jgi:hypothetical protein